MTLGEAIKRLRTLKGMNQKKLATGSGIDQGHLSNIERNRANPSIDTLKKLAKALDTHSLLIHWMAFQESELPPSSKAKYMTLKADIETWIKDNQILT